MHVSLFFFIVLVSPDFSSLALNYSCSARGVSSKSKVLNTALVAGWSGSACLKYQSCSVSISVVQISFPAAGLLEVPGWGLLENSERHLATGSCRPSQSDGELHYTALGSVRGTWCSPFSLPLPPSLLNPPPLPIVTRREMTSDGLPPAQRRVASLLSKSQLTHHVALFILQIFLCIHLWKSHFIMFIR